MQHLLPLVILFLHFWQKKSCKTFSLCWSLSLSVGYSGEVYLYTALKKLSHELQMFPCCTPLIVGLSLQALNAVKVFRCHLCPYTTNRHDHLGTHVRKHTGEKPYQCSLCPYSSAVEGSVKRHYLTHTGERPFKCSHCSYRALQRSDLKIHLRTHTGERPYACPFPNCTYAATHSSNLRKHLQIHSWLWGRCGYV